MKNLLKFSVLLLAAGLVLGLAGCKTEEEEDDGGGDVSFQSFTPPSIWVENLTGQRLVAFKGSLQPANLIGGVPAYSGQHGLQKKPALFNSTQTVILLFITEAQYKANKNNLGALNNQVFARVFAFYNNNGTNNNVFQISSKIGGEGRLNIVNSTSFNVEIRNGGVTGEILGYAASGMTSGNVIYLNPDDYEIYPVYKFYHPTEHELYSAIPKFRTGELANKPFFQPYGIYEPNLNRTFNISDIDMTDLALSSGGVYIRVINDSLSDVRVWNGNNPMYATTAGFSYIPTGSDALFTIQFEKDNDGKYPASRQISTLRIGAGSNMKLVDPATYQLDYKYTITVSGPNASNITVGTPVEVEQVDLSTMFGF